MDVETVLRRRDNSIMALTVINIVTVLFLVLLFYTEFDDGSRIEKTVFTYDVYLLPIIIVIQFLLLHRVLGVFLLFVFDRRGKDIKKCDPKEKFGNYSADDIQRMVEHQCSKMGVTSVKRVYIIKSQTSNALTLDVVLFEPFRFSVVVLFENLFHIMNEGELEAIIGHEIAHVKNRDSWYLGLVGNPTIMMVFILFYLAQSLGIYGVHHSFVFLVLISMCVFYLTLRPFVKRMVRYCEYYADYTSAKTNGLVVTINALIKLGQRKDTLVAFQYEFQKRFRLDMKTHISSEFSKRLNEELENVLDPDEAMGVARKLIKEFGGAEKEFRENKFGSLDLFRPKIIDWREYDDHIRDYSLDIEELGPLIHDLKDAPHARLFKHASTGRILALLQTHPRIRDRIIFLWDSLKDEVIKAKGVPHIDMSEGGGETVTKRYICPICQKRFVVRVRVGESLEMRCPGCGITGEV